MAPQISLITPVGENDIHFLLEAYQSLDKQEVDWEWIVQVDSPQLDLSFLPKDDGRIAVLHNPRPMGIAATRNRALARCEAPLVTLLDSDDCLSDDSLVCRISTLEENPQAAFVWAAAEDWDPKKNWSKSRWPLDHWREGLHAPGELEKHWRTRGRWGFTGTTVLAHKKYLMAVGGWPALYTGDDGCLTLSLNTLWPAVYLPQVVYQVRQHPGQASRRPDFKSDRHASWNFIHQRLHALRQAEGIAQPTGWDHAPEYGRGI